MQALEPVEAKSVCYRGTASPDKVRVSIRHSQSLAQVAETLSMTLTVAHISPVMSVIAGLLILIMPRLLNLVVAIFLILNGLIGLGLLKWLHL
jgi:ABC-type bacteriocin/lantibiotic exporter with double-glycine peptidase domain